MWLDQDLRVFTATHRVHGGAHAVLTIGRRIGRIGALLIWWGPYLLCHQDGAFRQRLIRTQMDRRLLERTVEVSARHKKEFDWRKVKGALKVAIDPRPLEGAGRRDPGGSLPRRPTLAAGSIGSAPPCGN